MGENEAYTYYDRTAWHRAGGKKSKKPLEAFLKKIRVKYTPLPGWEKMKVSQRQARIRRECRKLEQKFEEFAQDLSERDRIILHQRLIADEPQTLQQIADLYGISGEAVRVAEKKLITKIKKYMASSFGDVREIEFNLRNRPGPSRYGAALRPASHGPHSC